MDSDSDGEDFSNEEEFIQCNKWRPYFYDMFNRVGNLTVLNLDNPTSSLINKLHNMEN